jgi:NADPH:quinone reductase-like Zn-dependent oxidoreductase
MQFEFMKWDANRSEDIGTGPKAGELRIKIEAGLNYIDICKREVFILSRCRCLGAEFAGWVDGLKVTEFRIGDRVAATSGSGDTEYGLSRRTISIPANVSNRQQPR